MNLIEKGAIFASLQLALSLPLAAASWTGCDGVCQMNIAPEGESHLVAASCGIDAKSDPLAGEWSVFMIDAIEGDNLAEPTLSFGESQLSGSTGCNRFRASAAWNRDGVLGLGAIAVTRKMCPPALMEVEKAMLGSLESARSYMLDDDGILTFYRGEEAVLRAKRP